MTIIEAISRLARHHTRRDFSALTAPDLADAVAALNLGMQELYQQLPPEFRQKTVSLAVPVPRTVDLEATNGSAALGDVVFTTREVGCSLICSADTVRHRVAGEAALADVWLGATGTHSVTLYGDAVAGEDYPFERIVSGPTLLVGDGYERELVRILGREDCGYWEEPSLAGVGEPRAYWLESQGNSQGVEPIIVIRLRPLPDRAYRLRYVASFAPRRIRFTDVEAGGPLPVPDNYADALLAASVMHLAGMPGWTVDAASAREKRDTAMRFIGRNRLPLNSAPNRVGTPIGF